MKSKSRDEFMEDAREAKMHYLNYMEHLSKQYGKQETRFGLMYLAAELAASVDANLGNNASLNMLAEVYVDAAAKIKAVKARKEAEC